MDEKDGKGIDFLRDYVTVLKCRRTMIYTLYYEISDPFYGLSKE